MRLNRITFLAVLLVALVQLWVLSAGWMTYWPQYTCHYSRLADAFSHGQCNLRFAPEPGLLALPDPYDPQANSIYQRRPGVHDAVLCNGKYFLYWGPVPALLMTPARMILGGRVIGDQYPVYAFTLGLTIAGALLMRRIFGRFFADLPPGMLALAVVLVGLCMPMLFTLARPAVYEAAILGGQCFLVGGICFAFPLDQAPGWKRSAAAGTCWAMAMGCRVSLLFAVCALCVLVAWKLLRRLPIAAAAKSLTALAVPLLLGAILLASYNIARFGDWSEFGQRYQLTNANYRSTPHLFQPANAIPGLYSYLFRPFGIHPDFPFLEAITGEHAFPRFIKLPEHYECNEPITGLLLVTPIVLFALSPLSRLALRKDGPEAARFTAALASAAILGFAPIPFMLGSTMRYLCDLAPCLLMLTSIGMWQGCQWHARADPARGRLGRLLRPLFVTGTTLAAAWSISAGLLLGITGYYQHFRVFHSHLFGNASYWMQEPAANDHR